MNAFKTLTAVAAPLPEDNIDTDIIYPGRFLLRIDKDNIGECLFYDRRFDNHGDENPDFILNREPYRHSPILIGGHNFGCGSSREHATWALADFGIRCVIAQSFGEIFYANCINNQILPITVATATRDHLIHLAHTEKAIQVNLETQLIGVDGSHEAFEFTLSSAHRDMLLQGLDEIALQLHADIGDIETFETHQKNSQPWLWVDNAINR